MARPVLNFTVSSGDRLAKFSSYADAFWYACERSKRYGHTFEVRDKTGLVAQFAKGELTPEFASRCMAEAA